VNDGSVCNDGIQDQPDATFDMTTEPPTLWAVWRHAQCGICASGGCVRRFILDASNGFRLKSIGDAFTVENMSSESCCEGQGSMRVRAGEGALTVMYLNSALRTCNTTNPSTGTSGLAYETVTSFNNGARWTQHSRLFHTDTFRNCVLDSNGSGPPPTLDINGRSFDFVRAPDGTYYAVAQHDKQSVRLFSTRAPFGDQSRWREWCPGTQQGVPPPATANWTLPGLFCQKISFRSPVNVLADGGVAGSIAWPTIAADDQGRVAFWFYESDPTDTTLHIRFFANVAPRDQSSDWQTTTFGGTFQPWNPAVFPLNLRTLGDYATMAVRGNASFGGGGTGAPACGNAGSFYPVWIRADADGGAGPVSRAQTTRVDFTP